MTTLKRRVPPQQLINLVNPLVRFALRSRLHGPLDGSLLLLHVVGRKTGRHYDIPVGYVALGDRFLVVTNHDWRVNLRGGVSVEVTHGGHRRPMRATLDEDPAAVARILDDAFRRLGPKALTLSGLSVDVDDPPTVDELASAATDLRLAIISLDALPAPASG